MKSIVARALRNTANALNSLADRLEPVKERIEAAKTATEAAISRAKGATLETVAELRQEAQETVQRGQVKAQGVPRTYLALVYVWAFIEGMVITLILSMLFGPLIGLFASMLISIFTINSTTRRATTFASLVFGLFSTNQEVCRA